MKESEGKKIVDFFKKIEKNYPSEIRSPNSDVDFAVHAVQLRFHLAGKWIRRSYNHDTWSHFTSPALYFFRGLDFRCDIKGTKSFSRGSRSNDLSWMLKEFNLSSRFCKPVPSLPTSSFMISLLMAPLSLPDDLLSAPPSCFPARSLSHDLSLPLSSLPTSSFVISRSTSFSPYQASLVLINLVYDLRLPFIQYERKSGMKNGINVF